MIKPLIDDLCAAVPELSRPVVSAFLSRLPDAYFTYFDREQWPLHLREMAQLAVDQPVRLRIDSLSEGKVSVTVMGFDYPFEFSLITGILSGNGFNILSGESFTYAPSDSLKDGSRSLIIDHFVGTLPPNQDSQVWTRQVKVHFNVVFADLEARSKDRLDAAELMVSRLVAERLGSMHLAGEPKTVPVDLQLDNSHPAFTRLRITAQDTPCFLYALSSALSRHDIDIVHVRIRTRGTKVEDEMDLSTRSGEKITDSGLLDRLRVSVILTKAFTYVLDRAPNPQRAFERFGALVDTIMSIPDNKKWVEFLSNPMALKDLARLLGTSDYLWEDFIRQHLESLLPILKPHLQDRHFYQGLSNAAERLKGLIENQPFDIQKAKINQFKDHELFAIDLNHILGGSNILTLSRQLTELAELVVRTSFEVVYADFVYRYGEPQTVAGLPVSVAIVGLGKLGGAAMGYASDIEMMVIYSDNGATSGQTVIANSEFFDSLMRGILNFIQTKRDGIFELDVRLRPYGKDGPLAVSLESFCHYYGPGGPAHFYELLALVRLRGFAGDRKFRSQIERLRDQFLYHSNRLQLKELWELRKKQFEEKTTANVKNAKFSPGALVDLEYAVQALQVEYGSRHPKVRTPRIRAALQALHEIGVLAQSVVLELEGAYLFLRQLNNSLRMLRGSAKDLDIPDPAHLDFAVLAERFGYRQTADLQATQQLHMDFEMHTAMVRVFVRNHFSQYAPLSTGVGTVADLILEATPSDALIAHVLQAAGFKNVKRAYANFRRLADLSGQRETFSRMAILACDQLGTHADPDRALNNWERFATQLPAPEAHFELIMGQPRRLPLMLDLFSSSQFLSDIVVKFPDWMDWVTSPQTLQSPLNRLQYRDLFLEWTQIHPDWDWRRLVRTFRQRHTLRVAVRDLCIQAPFLDITRGLSHLAETILAETVDHFWGLFPPTINGYSKDDLKASVCVLAFGKLGGTELNYSSDIDLVVIWDHTRVRSGDVEDMMAILTQLTRDLQSELMTHTSEGMAYRVDFNLRPYGRTGHLVVTVAEMLDYYASAARFWEFQALLKARPVAGNWGVGFDFLYEVFPIMLRGCAKHDILGRVLKMRNKRLAQLSQSEGDVVNVKLGRGGIRDIEFLAQALQLARLTQWTGLARRNTLYVLSRLHLSGQLRLEDSRMLQVNYVFLRRLEHLLQMLEDRQTHRLPDDPTELLALARKLGGADAIAESLKSSVAEQMEAVATLFEHTIKESIQ